MWNRRRRKRKPAVTPKTESKKREEASPDEPPRTKLRILFDKYWEIAGGRSLTASFLIHLLLVIIAALIVNKTISEPKLDFLPGGGSKGANEASAQVATSVQKKKRFAFDKTPLHKIMSTGAATIALPDIPLDAMKLPETKSLMSGGMSSAGFGTSGAGGGFGKGQGIGGQAGFVSLPPSMRSRCSPAERLQKLRESGGSSQTEAIVSRALEWLKTKQNDDGSWGSQYPGAMTGLALLCYLGRCETPDSPYYGEQSMKGILYLMELAKKNKLGVMAVNPAGHACPYEHGIATYALGEMYSLARLGGRAVPGMRETFEQGVKVIIDYQLESGSWAYGFGGAIAYVKRGEDDLSVTGWQYQALKAAKFSGVHINGLQQAIDKSVKYMERTQTKDGGFGNPNLNSSYNQWSLSGIAILGLQTLGQSRGNIIPNGLKFANSLFAKEPPDWNHNANLYCWYYYTQAFFQAGGGDWKKWNDTAMAQIMGNQKNDGGWSEERPSMQLASTEYAGKDADVYRTSLCTLMCEVYYRYLKVGDKQQGSIFQR